jgi:hypothetical protein
LYHTKKKETLALFSAAVIPDNARAALAREGVLVYDLTQLLAQANSDEGDLNA